MSACSNRRQGGLSNSNGVPCRRIPAKRAPEKARPNPRDAERPNAEWKLGRSSEFWLTGRIPEIRFGSPWGRSPSTRLLPDDPVHPDFTGPRQRLREIIRKRCGRCQKGPRAWSILTFMPTGIHEERSWKNRRLGTNRREGERRYLETFAWIHGESRGWAAPYNVVLVLRGSLHCPHSLSGSAMVATLSSGTKP